MIRGVGFFVLFELVVGLLGTPAAAAEPRSTPGVEFFDPLGDPSSSHLGSRSGDPSNFVFGFESGEYVIKIVNPDYDRAPTVFPNGIYSDVDVAVDARLYGETQGRYVFAACRAQPDGGGSYRLTVDPAVGKLLLSRWDANDSVKLVDWTYRESIAVQNVANRIQLRCQGDTIEALVNGDSVATVKDATYASGEVAIGASRFSNVSPRTVDARFKNMRVSMHLAPVGTGDGSCANGRLPAFTLGFAELKAQVGAQMGEAIECEHPNPANGDSLQRTSTGVALYRQRTNLATFTDGSTHWALTARGLIQWGGESVDPPFWQFAGVWGRHGFGISVTGDGRGDAVWRTYRWCGDPDVTDPCDSLSGNLIISGGRAKLALDGRQGAVARGRVLESTDTSVMAPGSFTLAIDANGLGEFKQNGHPLNLCGPAYPTLATPEVQKTNPCGA